MVATECRFKPGDKVALSATFLRSIDPSAAKGWPTRYDKGKGIVIEVIDVGGTFLATVIFINPACQLTINTFNLVHDRDIYNEAMRAEHKSRNVEINC